MTVERGRPSDVESRLEVEIRSYELLDSLGIEYERADHEPCMTMEACEAVDLALGVKTAKNLLLTNRQQTDFYLLLMPGDKPFKTKHLSAQLGTARLSFASAEQMTELLGVTPGSLTVLGLMNDTECRVSLVIDSEILSESEFGCHPCINTSTLKFKTEDLTEKLIPKMKHSFVTVDLKREEEL